MVAAVVPAVAGVALSWRRAANGFAIFGALVWTGIGALVVAQSHDTEVTAWAFLKGELLGATALGLVPFAGYYVLGRLLAERRAWLALGVVASLPVFAYYLLIAYVIAILFVGCAPDKHECL